MPDLGRRKRSVSLLPRHIAFIRWNDISQSQIIQETLDNRIRAAGFEPAAVRDRLFTLCQTGKPLETVIAELDSCTELFNDPSITHSCN